MVKDIIEKEHESLIEVLLSARNVQEFLWSDLNTKWGLEEFKRMLRKRISKIDEIHIDNPYWKIEMRKRLLQITAVTISLLSKINDGKITKGIHPTQPSNLDKFKSEVTKC